VIYTVRDKLLNYARPRLLKGFWMQFYSAYSGGQTPYLSYRSSMLEVGDEKPFNNYEQEISLAKRGL